MKLGKKEKALRAQGYQIFQIVFSYLCLIASGL